MTRRSKGKIKPSLRNYERDNAALEAARRALQGTRHIDGFTVRSKFILPSRRRGSRIVVHFWVTHVHTQKRVDCRMTIYERPWGAKVVWWAKMFREMALHASGRDEQIRTDQAQRHEEFMARLTAPRQERYEVDVVGDLPETHKIRKGWW